MISCNLLAMVLFVGPTQASLTLPLQEKDHTPAVIVTALRDADWKSYSTMLKGIDAFEKDRQMAPNAPLLFALRPLKAETSLAGVAVSLRNDDNSLQLQMTSDGLFSLPRNDTFSAVKDTELSLNRKKDLFFWSPYIRTPDIPNNMLRLGDLRLECLVRWAIEKEDASFMERSFFSLMGGQCTSEKIAFFYRANKFLSNVILIDGDRRQTIPTSYIRSDKKSFRLPLHDKNWHDDTLIELVLNVADSPKEIPEAPIMINN